MKIQYYILFAISFLFNAGIAQVRPDSTISTFTGGAIGDECLSCTVQNPDNAWDTSDTTYCLLDIDSSGLGGYAYVTYEFPGNQDLNSYMTIKMSIDGVPILSSAMSDSIYNRLSIEVQDQSGNAIALYDSSNRAAVELLDSATNQFNIRIVNQSTSMIRVKIQAHSLDSPLTRDILIYDVSYVQRDFNFAIQNTTAGSGFSGGLMTSCPGCSASNLDWAAMSFDENSEPAQMLIPGGAAISPSDYLYASYDWNSTVFDGSAFDVFIILEMPGISTVPSSVFANDELEVQVTYDDASTQIFNGSSGSATAARLHLGADRFAIQIDLDDAKYLSAVEVRLHESQGSVDNDLHIFTIFSAPSGFNPLPADILSFEARLGDNGTVALSWETSSETNSDYFQVEHSTDGNDWKPVVTVDGAGTTREHHVYRNSHDSPMVGLNHYRLVLTDLNGTQHKSHQTMVEKKAIQAMSIFPNPCTAGKTNLDIVTSEPISLEIVISDMGGKPVRTIIRNEVQIGHHGLDIDMHGLASGLYIFSVRAGGERHFSRVQVQN